MAKQVNQFAYAPNMRAPLHAIAANKGGAPDDDDNDNDDDADADDETSQMSASVGTERSCTLRCTHTHTNIV